MSKWARKRDINEKPIIAALRSAGATVQQLDGSGVPDLVVGFRGVNTLIEVKQAGVDKPIKRTTRGASHDDRGLGEKQRAWIDGWKGMPVLVVTTAHQALVAVGAVIESAPCDPGTTEPEIIVQADPVPQPHSLTSTDDVGGESVDLHAHSSHESGQL